MMSWQTILAIGSGGFLGAVTRAYLNGQINNHLPHSLPFGTLGVNLIGSFIIRILFAYFSYTTLFSVHAKSFLTTGFLGALTTYSTFAMETVFFTGRRQYRDGSSQYGIESFRLCPYGWKRVLSVSPLLRVIISSAHHFAKSPSWVINKTPIPSMCFTISFIMSS